MPDHRQWRTSQVPAWPWTETGRARFTPWEVAGMATVSRRSVLTAGLAAGAVLLPAPASAEEPPYHGVTPGTEPGVPEPERDLVSPETLGRHRGVSGAVLYYEVTGRRTSFQFDEGFYRQLALWRNRIGRYVPRVWGSPSRIYSFGAYVRKRGYHGKGRAFDIASVYFTTRRGTLVKRFDCRYDRWRRSPHRAEIRARYWALAASLHHRFRHVLTYLYDADHHNHIHVDNAVYGQYQDALFDPESSSQVQHVQACCRYVWGLRTRITSDWNSQTRRHCTEVLRRCGVEQGTIVDSNYGWRMFNYATLLQGTGRRL